MRRIKILVLSSLLCIAMAAVLTHFYKVFFVAAPIEALYDEILEYGKILNPKWVERVRKSPGSVSWRCRATKYEFYIEYHYGVDLALELHVTDNHRLYVFVDEGYSGFGVNMSEFDEFETTLAGRLIEKSITGEQQTEYRRLAQKAFDCLREGSPRDMVFK